LRRGDPVAGTHDHRLWNMGPQHKRVYARLRRAMRGDGSERLRGSRLMTSASGVGGMEDKPAHAPREFILLSTLFLKCC
jgi:hypothetical protein